MRTWTLGKVEVGAVFTPDYWSFGLTFGWMFRPNLTLSFGPVRVYVEEA